MNLRIARQVEHVQQLINTGALVQAARLCHSLSSSGRAPLNVVQHLLGVIALRQGKFQDALNIYSRLLTLTSDKPEYLYNCGVAALGLGDNQRAVECLCRVVQLMPRHAVAWSDLCLAQVRDGSNPEAAVASGRQAVSLKPESAAAHYNLALALQVWRDLNAALQHFLEADSLLPGHLNIDFDLGNVYIGLGETAKAAERFRSVISRFPREVGAYVNLTRITRYESPDHRDARQLRQFLGEDWLTPDQRASACFALGKIYQDCEQYDQAFEYYLQGNRIRDEMFAFDPEVFTASIESIKRYYTRKLITEKSSYGMKTNTPVFIVGTPRSGTTLVDQIISSHTDVYGAGELNWVFMAVNALPGFMASRDGYPACVGQLTQEHCSYLASKYMDYISRLSGSESRVTDKMPGNFLHVGLIHILFLDARIIHCSREPLDACVSMFTNNFTNGVVYSYNLKKLGCYYRAYLSLMEHWRVVLSDHAIIEVGYEELVKDHEKTSRRLIASLGLDWHGDCLKFYQHKRCVLTTSDLQVRKPVYRSSVGRWRHYARHLGPLREALQA